MPLTEFEKEQSRKRIAGFITEHFAAQRANRLRSHSESEGAEFYGYGIANFLEAHSLEHDEPVIPYGTIYKALGRLNKFGYLEIADQPTEPPRSFGGRRGKLYGITEDGTRRLNGGQPILDSEPAELLPVEKDILSAAQFFKDAAKEQK